MIKRITRILIFLLLALSLSACGKNGITQITLVSEGEHTLSGDLPGELVLLGGTVQLPAGSSLAGSAHIFSGSLIMDGSVQGDVSLLNGTLTIGPSARILGNLNLGNEDVKIDPRARIYGATQRGSGITLPDLPDTPPAGIGVRLSRALLSALLLGLAALILARLIPSALRRSGTAAFHHPLISGAMGLLAGIIGLSLLVTIAYTIVLIPVSLLGMFVLIAAVFFGWMSMGLQLAGLLLRSSRRKISVPAQAFLGTGLVILILEALAAIPLIGSWISMLAMLVGLGAVFLTRFGWREFVPSVSPDD